MKTKTLFLTAALSTFFFANAFSQAAEIEWQNTIGGNTDEVLVSITQTTDGGSVLGGWSYSGISGDKTEANLGLGDYWVVKLDASGNIIWQSTIGGNKNDNLLSVIQTSDGGYLLGGYSDSDISGDKTEPNLGDVDYWVVKVDVSGNIVWQNTIGGSGADVLQSVIQATDGGYLLGGYSYSGISGDKTEANSGYQDYWVIKLDVSGNITWQNTIGGSVNDDLTSVIETMDGGYLLGGYSSSGISGDKTEDDMGSFDYWVIKLDEFGNLTWQNTIGGNDWDRLYSILQASDGGYLLGGYSYSGLSGDKTEAVLGMSDYWVVKLDPLGNIMWQNTIGGSNMDELNSMFSAKDGGYFLGGFSYSGISGDKTEGKRGWNDYWVIKLDVSGNLIWQKTIGGNNEDWLYSVTQTIDGGYLIGGYSYSGISDDKTEGKMGGSDYWIVKLFPEVCAIPSSLSVINLTSTSAKLIWDDLSGVAGYKVKYKVAGTSEWTAVQSNDNDKTLSGLIANTEYTWQVKSICSVQPVNSSQWSEKQFFTTNSLKLSSEKKLEFEVYPNPFSTSTTISFSLEENSHTTLELFDLAGRNLPAGRQGIRTLLDENLEPGMHEINFDRHLIPAGIYCLRIKTGSEVHNQKIIIQ